MMPRLHQTKDNGTHFSGGNVKQTLKITGRVRGILRSATTNKILLITPWNHNIVPTEGLVAIANRLGDIGAKANEGIVTYGAVGTGSSTPLISDTQMLTEFFRKLIASASTTNSVSKIQTFLAAGEGNDTLSQFALFGEDAGAGANSGTLFQYANFAGAITKTSNETLTIESELTIA